MTWLTILLAFAGLGGSPTMEVKPRKCAAQTSIGAAAYTSAASKACKKKAPAKKAPKKPTKPGTDKPTTNPSPRTEPGSGGDPKPEATPTPKPGATATPTPTATPTATPTPGPGTYPTRTNVDLTDTREWTVRPSYRTLAAGKIDFNVNNRGEDDHNLTVRTADDRDLAHLDLAPGETGTLSVELALGTYTLYCSLPLHEEAGMKATISVR